MKGVSASLSMAWLVLFVCAGSTARAAAPQHEPLDLWLSQEAPPSSSRSASDAAGAPARLELGSAPAFVSTPANWSEGTRWSGMSVGDAALAQLKVLAPELGHLREADLTLRTVSTNGLGLHVVRLEQRREGLPVFRGGVNLLLDARKNLVAASGVVAPGGLETAAQARAPVRLGARAAVATALADLTGEEVASELLVAAPGAQAGEQRLEFASYARQPSLQLLKPVRAREVWFPMGPVLKRAWYVEALVGGPERPSLYFAHVVSDTDGQLLLRQDLTRDAAHTYRVWADPAPPFTPHDGPHGSAGSPYPAGSPYTEATLSVPFAPSALVTLDSAPFSRANPWLPAGATVTTGNNVDAYADLREPDGFSTGDLRARTTSVGAFDHTWDMGLTPGGSDTQIQAAIVDLFFVTNWLHDWFYDAGFAEADGNAQADNFGRGGRGGDRLLAEAQDWSGIDNANMATPADGESPRMQMYRFVGRGVSRVTVLAPEDLVGGLETRGAGFGPQQFELTGAVVAPGVDTSFCTPAPDPALLSGRLVIAREGNCDAVTKARHAQDAGARGLIVDARGFGFPYLPISASEVVIPVLGVTEPVGARLREALSSGLEVRMSRSPPTENDASLDHSIVAHEWGHMLSNRLIGDGTGLVNLQGGSLGEGWSEFVALLMMVRPEDAAHPANADWTGAYALGTHAKRGTIADSDYFGSRRAPYSVDPAKNALTFRHITNGQALPEHPLQPNGAPNAEVHNAGEVWASALWECYVSLLRDTPRLDFPEAQRRMKAYVVTGLKLTPPSPTFLEARDALLAAMRAHDAQDHLRCAQAFARRGMGVGAEGPWRGSWESVGCGGELRRGLGSRWVTGSVSDASTVGRCDDDGLLDDGETGTLHLQFQNAGWFPTGEATVSVSTSSTGITFPAGAMVALPTTAPGAVAQVELPVRLEGVTGRVAIPFTVTFEDAASARPGPQTAAFLASVNGDELPATSRSESVESAVVLGEGGPWTVTHNAFGADVDFRILQQPDGNRVFHAPNVAVVSDLSLVTPAFVVGPETATVSFRHLYEFDYDFSRFDGETHFYDGAVVEITTDGGIAWKDLGPWFAKPGGYTGRLLEYQGNANPLLYRPLFVGNSWGWREELIQLRTDFKGQVVQLRFRVGTDAYTGAGGWFIDDFAITGSVNTPFTGHGPEDGRCTALEPTVDAGGDLAVEERLPVTLSGRVGNVEGQAVAVHWTQVGSGPAVELVGASTLAPHFTAPEVAVDTILEFELRATTAVASVSDRARVTVRHVNREPVASAGEDQTAEEGSSVVLQASAEDPDGDPLSFQWSQLIGRKVRVEGAETARATFLAPAVGDTDGKLLFRLVTSDGRLETTDYVEIAVHPRTSELVVEAGEPRGVAPGAEVVLKASVSGATGALSIAWSQTDGPAVALTGAQTDTVTFVAPGSGAESRARLRGDRHRPGPVSGPPTR